MAKINKKIFLVLFTFVTLFIGIKSIYGVLYTDGNSIGDYGSCSGGSYNGCIDAVGFEFTVVQITQHDQNGFQYKNVPNTYSFRLYKNFGLGNKLWYNSPNTFKTLDIIAEGGDVFNAIMTGTNAKNVLGNNFYVKSNNYAILVEELFGIIYWTGNSRSRYNYSDNDCVYFDGVNTHGCNDTINFNQLDKNSFNGYYIADRMLKLLELPTHATRAFPNDGYEKYNGWRSVTAALSCNLYIKTNKKAADLCKDPNYWTYDKEPERRKQISSWLMAVKLQGILKNYNAGIVYGYNVPKPQGNLYLQKVNTSGTLITGSPATVKVCKAGSSNCIYRTFYGSTTIYDLDVGTYYIYETQAPVGYYIPNNNYYVGSVNVTSGSTVTFKITNKNECEYKFDSLPNKNSMTQRINLFLEFLGRNPSKKYTNLLNLDMRQGKDACKNAMCIDSYISGCLSSQKGPNSTFNERNLSCYESKMGSKNTPIFCKSNYTFYSRISYKGNIGTSYNYYGTSINFGNFKSGRMVLNFDEANRKIAEGTLTVTCYVAGTNRGNEAEKLNFNYHDYVNKVCLYNETDNSCNTETNYLVEDNLQSNISNTPVGSELVKHTTILKYDYLLRPIYGKYGSGELTYDKINSRLLGYGIISKFSDGNIANSENKLKFEIPSLRVSNTSCTYNVDQEIVESDCPNGNCDGDNTSWELNLAFRQISKLNPFPGKSGSGRKVGTNWCDGDNCNNDNKIVEETITDKNDSYNSTGDGPKYIINLNSKTIQEIKEKYKGQAYDDFGESCDTPDGTCASDFIKWMSDEGIFQEKIIEEG